jgi:transposase InsO family protein
MKSAIAVNALNSAVARRGIGGTDVAGCIVHSDRGSQFRWSRKFLATLRRHDLLGSMGQVASAGDNAAMESFFALQQRNVLDRRRWTIREELRIAIVTLDRTDLSAPPTPGPPRTLDPIEHEATMTTQVALAA